MATKKRPFRDKEKKPTGCGRGAGFRKSQKEHPILQMNRIGNFLGEKENSSPSQPESFWGCGPLANTGRGEGVPG